MAYFKVNADDLMTTAAQLDLALSVITEVEGRAESIFSMASACGRRDVQSAIEGFLSAWTYGVSYMKHDLIVIQALLQAAGGAYLKTEDAIVQAATP